MSTSIRPGWKIFLKRRNQFFRLTIVERAVKKIHPDDAERFLLVDVGFVEQPNVDNDLAWLPAWLGLKAHAQPAMRFIALFETARRNWCRQRQRTFSPLRILRRAVR